MPATPITKATRYFRAGIDKVYFVTTVADYVGVGPLRTELNAGKDLSPDIAEISGWTVAGNNIETPDLASEFTSSIPGRTAADESSLTMYASEDGADVRTVLPRGTAGYVVFMDGGDVEDNTMDVYPVRVTSLGKVRSLGDEAATLTVTFAITSVPNEDVPIPAAA